MDMHKSIKHALLKELIKHLNMDEGSKLTPLHESKMMPSASVAPVEQTKFAVENSSNPDVKHAEESIKDTQLGTAPTKTESVFDIKKKKSEKILK